MPFQIFTANEISSLRKAGKILSECLKETAKHVRPGITTGELDRIAEAFILQHDGAKPAFKGYRGYPATLCISVNDEAVHGIPGGYTLGDGDIVSLDGGVIVDGLYTDACITVPVGIVSPEVQRFLETTKAALEAAKKIIRAGMRIGDISSTIQTVVEKEGYKSIRVLTGHGLGRSLHQFPDIPNIGRPGTGPVLPAGTIIAVEPITSMGSDDITEDKDGWTLRTKDGAMAAHFEHTFLVTGKGCEVLA